MTHSPKSKAQEFRLEDVVVIKTPNDCKWCERRVNSYVESVKEWQRSYDQALKRIERLSIALERIRDNCESSYKWIESECTKALAADQGEET